jgi:hypothetical protein
MNSTVTLNGDAPSRTYGGVMDGLQPRPNRVVARIF